MAHQRRDDEDWNVLAVCRRHRTGAALSALSSLGRFRTAGYPQVLVGTAARGVGAAPFDGIEDLAEGRGAFADLFERVLAVEEALGFVRDDVTETLCEAFEGFGPRIAGRSFYVRVHLRGLKGRLEHPAVERALGEFLFEKAAAAGAAPTVRFRDVDVTVVAEVVGRRVGYAFLDREARARALVHVR